MAQPSTRRATYADLEALPPNLVGELIDGELFASPRPASRHAVTHSWLTAELVSAFWRGRSGPGGWVILLEPELHFGENVLVPDIAGWRRAHMPTIPDVAAFTLAPDWLVEVMSPSTMRLDRLRKLPVYARAGVEHVWLIDPIEQTLEVFRLDRERVRYALKLTARGEQVVRAEPFDAIELVLGELWER